MMAGGAKRGAAAARRDSWLRPAIALLCLASLYPFAAAPVSLLTDWPNHLARMYIAANVRTAPDLARFWEVQWSVAPNVAVEGMLYALQSVTDIFTAGRIVICFVLLTIVSGYLHLRHALYGRLDALSLLVFPLLSSTALAWGFLNFCLSLGLSLHMMALLLKLHGRFNRLLLLFLPLSGLLFLTHIFGWACFLYLSGWVLFFIVLREAGFRAAFARAALYGITGGILPLLLWLQTPPPGWGPLDTVWGQFGDKLQAFTGGVLFHHQKFDLPLFFPFLLLAALRFVKIPGPFLGAILLGCAAAVAVPVKLHGVYLADIRLPQMLLLLLAATMAVRENPPLPFHLLKRILIALLLLASALRYAAQLESQRACGAIAQAYVEDIRSSTARNATLIGFLNYEAEPPCGFATGFSHLTSLAVPANHLFVPNVMTGIPPVRAIAAYDFADARIAAAPPASFLDSSAADPQRPAYWDGWRARYDYMTYFHLGENRDLPALSGLRPVAEREYYTIYRLRE